MLARTPKEDLWDDNHCTQGSVFSAGCDFFILFVHQISPEPLNEFAPNSPRRCVWSLARTSFNFVETELCSVFLCCGRVISRTLDHCRSGWRTRRSCCTLWSKIKTSASAPLLHRTILLTLFTWRSLCLRRVFSLSWHTPCLHFWVQTPVRVCCAFLMSD